MLIIDTMHSQREGISYMCVLLIDPTQALKYYATWRLLLKVDLTLGLALKIPINVIEVI